MKRRLPFLALAASILALWGAGALEPFERLIMNLRFGLWARDARAGVVLVAIDSKSLRSLDVWPWVRGYHATVLEQLLESGAERVAFDIDFSSRSIAEEDGEFEHALAKAGPRVILPVFRQTEWAGDGRQRETFTVPLDAFRRHATLATINIRPERDGVVRRYLTRDVLDGAEVPSFATALTGLPRPEFQAFYLDYGIDPDSVPRISYVDLLTGRFDPKEIEGKSVIVGSTAVEMGDHVAVPLRASLPGSVLQALAFESLMDERALRRSGSLTVLALTLLTGMLSVLRLEHASWRSGLVSAVLLAGGLFFATAGALLIAPVLVDVSPPILMVAGTYAIATGRRIDQQRLRLLLQSLRLQQTETLMRHVVDNSFDAILTVDRQGHVETANPAAGEMFGLSTSALAGRPIGELVLRRKRSAKSPGPYGPRDAVGIRYGGARFPAEVAVSVIAGDEESRRVYFIRDVTEQRAQEQALEHQAKHDGLTGLPNRVLLVERLEQALARAEKDGNSVALMILDVNRFKEINDTLGHHVGDTLLRMVVGRLEEAIGEEQTLSRFGADEFAILLPDAGLEAALVSAQRLIATLEAPLDLYDLSLRVEASVGVAIYPGHGNDAAELVQRADVAMHTAKRARSELAVYDAQQDFSSLRNLTLSGDLRSAIEEDELELVYQPKVSCNAARLIGVEALVRWRHPKHGPLSPLEFIRIAEHSGLIKPLSWWVLRAAVRQCAEWLRRGCEIPVAVNLSARNLQEEDLPASLAGLLGEVELPSRLLTLEITESVIMEDPQRAMAVVTKFNDMGIRIAIDDFGTGYSSLAYLKKLPAREIKIDRAFVRQLDRDRDDAIIVSSTIEMAHNLGLKVVAEGIENERTWSELKTLGCDVGQGFFFSKPLPAPALIEWLDESPWELPRAAEESEEDEEHRRRDASIA